MRSEVRALEHAACALVTKLEIILRGGWGLQLFNVGEGLVVSTPDHLPDEGEDAFVTIRPKGWPKESFISAHYFRYGPTAWTMTDFGEIRANHLDIPIDGLRFRPTSEGLGIRLERGFGELQEHFVTSGYRQLIKSLKEDEKSRRKT